MATENVEAWSKTAATNSSADSGINWAEGQDPASVNNSARGMMAAIAKQSDDQGGGLTAGGTANALTVTTNQVLASGQITDGLMLQIEAASDNTSATVTFAPDGLTAANIKRADGSALAIGSIKSGMRLFLCYDSGASEWRCANIAPININPGSPGIVLLASGTVSSAASLALVLTSYTAYRGLKFVLSGFLPASDGVALGMEISTNGGSSYIATNYDEIISDLDVTAATNTTRAGAGDTWWGLSYLPMIGNGAAEGVNGEITLLNQSSTAFWPRISWDLVIVDNTATPHSRIIKGGGVNRAANDVDAVRFSFSAGNIAAGNYAVYGLV